MHSLLFRARNSPGSIGRQKLRGCPTCIFFRMPTAVKGAKGRVPLFQTLDRARAHFITVSSASESGSERDIGEESEYDEERIALSTAGEGEMVIDTRSGL